MSTNPKFFVLAYYHFTAIPNPQQEVLSHKAFLRERQIACRVYISEQGINGQLSGLQEDAEAYMNWLHANPLFAEIPFKIHTYHENVFPRQTVKYRKQLVALDEEVDMTQIGEHVDPTEWKEMLQNEKARMVKLTRKD